MPANIYGLGHRPDIREQLCHYCTCVWTTDANKTIYKTGFFLFVDKDFCPSYNFSYELDHQIAAEDVTKDHLQRRNSTIGLLSESTPFQTFAV